MAQETLGMIETLGLVTAMSAADAAGKAANVALGPHVKSAGKGMYMVLVQGDVAAVQAAVDAGAAAGRAVGQIVGAHVIARPADGMAEFLGLNQAAKKPATRRRKKADEDE